MGLGVLIAILFPDDADVEEAVLTLPAEEAALVLLAEEMALALLAEKTAPLLLAEEVVLALLAEEVVLISLSVLVFPDENMIFPSVIIIISIHYRSCTIE